MRKTTLGRRPLGRSIALILALGAFLLASLSGPASDAGVLGRPGGKLVPARGAMFGTTVDGPGGNGIRVGTLERKIGRKFRIVQHYYGWTNPFPSGIEPNMLKHGRIPMIGWRGTALRAINSGRYDGMIRRDAIGVRKLHKQVFIRWGYEMNGSWEPWGGAQNGGANGGAKRFVKAYRRIHNIFTRNGATNAVWIWSPNWEDTPHKPWNHWTRYYPGDRYVDWVGIDGFNWGSSQSWSHWVYADHFIPGIYRDYHNRKPIMLAETASVEQGGSKARWITRVANQIKNNYPAVGAFVYFNGTDEHDSSIVWAVTSSRAAMSAFRKMGHMPYYAYRRG